MRLWCGNEPGEPNGMTIIAALKARHCLSALADKSQFVDPFIQTRYIQKQAQQSCCACCPFWGNYFSCLPSEKALPTRSPSV